MANLKIETVTADDEIGRIIHRSILCEYCKRHILVGEEATCLGEGYLQIADEIKNFKVRHDDVWVASYPRTGTTWTQEMVWMIANNLDFRRAQEILTTRYTFLEVTSVMDYKRLYHAMGVDDDGKTSVERAIAKKSPRFIKTHLPFALLPDQILNGTKSPKLIYVMRNPKDVAVSYYHHGKLWEGWNINLEDFCKVFMAGKAMFGCFWKHILGYWSRRNSPNILIIRYEDMKRDIRATIRQVSKFLGKNLTEEQIDALAEHLSFESMKNNRAVNRVEPAERLKKFNMTSSTSEFIRIGKVGQYKEELTPEMVKTFDSWIKKSVSGTELEEEQTFKL